MTFAHAGDRRHDLTRRAIAALKRVVVDECLLHRMQTVAACEPLDRRDRLALGRNRERQAA